MIDVSKDALAKARGVISGNLDRQVKKGTLDAAGKEAALSRISDATSLDAVRDASLVIEAATERADLKFKIFEDLDRHAAAGTILASNTSSISD